MAKFLLTQDVIQKLYDAGLIAEKPEYVRRVVFDLEAGEIGRMYIEKFADDAFLDVLIEARGEGLKVIPPLLSPDEIGPDDIPQRVGVHMRKAFGRQVIVGLQDAAHLLRRRLLLSAPQARRVARRKSSHRRRTHETTWTLTPPSSRRSNQEREPNDG